MSCQGWARRSASSRQLNWIKERDKDPRPSRDQVRSPHHQRMHLKDIHRTPVAAGDPGSPAQSTP